MTSVAIIGAGFSGMAAAIQLIAAGHDVTIYERSHDVGGVWRENTYPGAACDVPSAYYCFSFDPNPRWSRRYAPQPEILDYLRAAADKYGVRQRIRFNTSVVAASFDIGTNRWCLETSRGDQFWADVLVPAVGQLSQPAVPAIPGRDCFAGPSFHSAQWDGSVSLFGRRVAVIGTGASSIQLVPEIAPIVGSLTVFQRSAPHIVPRPDSRLTRLHHLLASRLPATLRAQRLTWLALTEGFTGVLHYSPLLSRAMTGLSRRFMRYQTRGDAELFEKVWPDYPLGCKRVLFSNAYLPALRRENVTLVTDSIVEITPNGVLSDTGEHHDADVIIYGTGFAAGGFLDHVTITGLDGATLRERWSQGARAYLGMAVPGFPNMFLMYGPNTNLGSGSIVAMLECQAVYIRQAVAALRGGTAIDVDPGTEKVYDGGLQARLTVGVWSRCDSWYVGPDGRVTTNWPGLVHEYRRRTKEFSISDYRVLLPEPTGPTRHAAMTDGGTR
ncbi:flavin-containing monooxygenase [Mycobacteroides franklinii]|uniref:NAD(P)/FAD-dependent oxidoreductase n=1 Tax=Mycobacteroides franklinii TaxID=948102 RepID=A0A4R5P452_9MYCO|nr:NAD(P)/FAD-dependent oxidoreductase [Mycobacteroides franklinii]ORA54480.1 4-hydroxyacetophenone monooxygenase [Mycobacteroides franklinii]TDH17729.1 NAD(P)/FAD-dependent oxidoreductase [Mycobacteroides franklinii]